MGVTVSDLVVCHYEKQPSTYAVGKLLVRRISLMRSERGKNGMIYTGIGSVN